MASSFGAHILLPSYCSVEKSFSFLDAKNVYLNESIETNHRTRIIMKRRHKRISFIILGLAALGIATTLQVLEALKPLSSLNLHRPP